MNLDDALHTFIAESRDLLEDMEAALLADAEAGDQSETVNAVFRAAHTIKVSAGLFGLDHVVAFAHVVESVLDDVRDGKVTLDAALVALFLACCDHIGALVDGLQQGATGPDALRAPQGEVLLASLRVYLAPAPVEAAGQAGRGADAGADNDPWHISLRFGAEVLRNGMDPLSFLRYLGQIGRIADIELVADALPEAAEMDPEACYLGFEIAFNSGAGKTAIEDVFEFVREDCAICILAPDSRIGEYIGLIEALPEDSARLGEMLVRCGSVTAQELAAALRTQAAHAAPSQPLGEILVWQGAVQPPVLEAALAKQERVKEGKAQETRTIRVDADKLDQLINLIGELTIAGASAHVLARRARNVELQESTSTLAGLVEQVRDGALQLRMVKISSTASWARSASRCSSSRST